MGSSSPVAIHEGEIPISEHVVRQLLRSQFPDLADEPIRRVESSGTVNSIFRIGVELAARFPLLHRHPGAERETLEVEARASSEFSRCSPFRAPQPVAIGEPGAGHPLPWSLQTWLPGDVAEDGAAADSSPFALDLVVLIRALRTADTAGRTFERGWRGGDLRRHDPWVQTCLKKSRHLLDVPRLAALWDRRDQPTDVHDGASHPGSHPRRHPHPVTTSRSTSRAGPRTTKPLATGPGASVRWSGRRDFETATLTLARCRSVFIPGV